MDYTTDLGEDCVAVVVDWCLYPGIVYAHGRRKMYCGILKVTLRSFQKNNCPRRHTKAHEEKLDGMNRDFFKSA